MRGKKRPPEERVSNKAGPLPPCKICGEPAAGFHYGVNTCEACKGFFRRSLVRKDEYICLGNGDCPIGMNRRKSCPKCRYERCLKFGMSIDAIKTGRYTYKKRNQDSLEIKIVEQVQKETGMTTSQLADIKDPMNLLKGSNDRGVNCSSPSPDKKEGNDKGDNNSTSQDKTTSTTIEEDITTSLLKHMQHLNASDNDDSSGHNQPLKRGKCISSVVQSTVELTDTQNSLSSSGNKDSFPSPTFQQRSVVESEEFLSSKSASSFSHGFIPTCSTNNTCKNLVFPDSPFASSSSSSCSSVSVSPNNAHNYFNSSKEDVNVPLTCDKRQTGHGSCTGAIFKSRFLSSEPSTLKSSSLSLTANCCGILESPSTDQCIPPFSNISEDDTCTDRSNYVNNSLGVANCNVGNNTKQQIKGSPTMVYESSVSKCGSELVGDAYTVLHDQDRSIDLAYNLTHKAQSRLCGVPGQDYQIQKHQNRHHSYQPDLRETFHPNNHGQLMTERNSEERFIDNAYKIKKPIKVQEPMACPSAFSFYDGTLRDSNGKRLSFGALSGVLTNSEAESYSSPTMNQQLPACLVVPLNSLHRQDCSADSERYNTGAIDLTQSPQPKTSTKLVETVSDRTPQLSENYCSSQLHHSHNRKPLETVQENSQRFYDRIYPSFFPFDKMRSSFCCSPDPERNRDEPDGQTELASSHVKSSQNDDDACQAPPNNSYASRQEEQLPPLLTWDPIPQVQYSEDELDSLMDTLVENHQRLIYDSLSLSDEFLQRGVRECKERCLLQDEVFGHLGFIEHAEYQHIYNSTGLDLDGRLEKIAQLADALDENVRHVISFVKTIPGFREFSLNSQKNLLKASISELYILGYYRGFLPGYHLIVDMKHAYCVHKILRLYPVEYTQRLFNIAYRLQHLRFSFKTIILLKALCVFFPDRVQLDDRYECEVMLDKYMQCLLLQLRREFPDRHGQVMAKVAQLLADLRVVERLYQHEWQTRISQYETMASKPILVELFA